MKKIIIVFALMLAFTLPVMADQGVQVFVNGSLISTPGQMYGERVFVPLRAVSESLGAKVSWDGRAAHVDMPDELKRPTIDGDEEFASVINQALDILEEKDFTDYSMICRDVEYIGQRKYDMGGTTIAGTMQQSVGIGPRLYNNKEKFVPLFMCGVLTHEAIHANSNRYRVEDIPKKEIETLAYTHEETALCLVGAPSWMIDETIRAKNQFAK